jgi:choline-sulfatase
MRPSNLLIILSDEHQREALGCYGHPLVQTPNLDRLAARGTRFTNAYTPSPICVPARASLATGRHVHQIGCWSSAEPYHGQVPSWGHRLIEAGHRVVSIGKLHYRATEDSNGFDEEILPLHVVDGVGWPRGLLRKDPPPFESARDLAAEIGPGETSYTDYDRRIAAAAVEWIKANGRPAGDRPWVLLVSFVSPHFPLVAPPDFGYTPLNGLGSGLVLPHSE